MLLTETDKNFLIFVSIAVPLIFIWACITDLGETPFFFSNKTQQGQPKK